MSVDCLLWDEPPKDPEVAEFNSLCVQVVAKQKVVLKPVSYNKD